MPAGFGPLPRICPTNAFARITNQVKERKKSVLCSTSSRPNCTIPCEQHAPSLERSTAGEETAAGTLQKSSYLRQVRLEHTRRPAPETRGRDNVAAESDPQSLCSVLFSSAYLSCTDRAPVSKNGRTRVSVPNLSGERHHRACPRKASFTTGTSGPLSEGAQKCSSPLLNFSTTMSLHLCGEGCTAGGRTTTHHHATQCVRCVRWTSIGHLKSGRPPLVSCLKEGRVEAVERHLAENSKGISGTDQSHLWSNWINQARLTA